MKQFLFSIFFISAAFSADNSTIPLPPTLLNKKEINTDKKLDKQENKKSEKENIVQQEKPLPITFKVGMNGSDGDVYAPLVGTICIFMNEENSNACRVKKYDGPIKTMEALLNGDIDIMVSNSLFAKYVFDGKEPFQNNMQHQKLRFAGSFLNETLIILARRDAKIKQLDDLKNTSINITKPYTKTRMVFESLMAAKKWQTSDFRQMTEFNIEEQIKAICNGDVQAIAIVGEEMNQYVKSTTRACEVNMIGFNNDELSLFKNDNRYVVENVDGGRYIGIPRDTATIAVRTVLLTTSDVANYQIEKFLITMHKRIKAIKLLHSGLQDLNFEKFANLGKTVPLHDGLTSFIQKHEEMLKQKPENK